MDEDTRRGTVATYATVATTTDFITVVPNCRYDIDDPPQPYPRTQYSEEIIDDIHSAGTVLGGR